VGGFKAKYTSSLTSIQNVGATIKQREPDLVVNVKDFK